MRKIPKFSFVHFVSYYATTANNCSLSRIRLSFRTWTTHRRRIWRPAGSCRSTIGRCSRCRSSWWATCCHWCWYASFTFACSSGCGARTASAPKAAAEGNESPGWSSSSSASSPSVGALYKSVSRRFLYSVCQILSRYSSVDACEISTRFCH